MNRLPKFALGFATGVCLSSMIVLVLLHRSPPNQRETSALPPIDLCERKLIHPGGDAIDDSYWAEDIEIGDGLVLPVRLDVTSKGNGSLKIANLQLKVHDCHGDESVYENDMLHTELADINQDGYRDIVISGRVLYYDEKEDIVMNLEDVVFVFLYDKDSRQFRETHRRASFSIQLPPFKDELR